MPCTKEKKYRVENKKENETSSKTTSELSLLLVELLVVNPQEALLRLVNSQPCWNITNLRWDTIIVAFCEFIRSGYNENEEGNSWEFSSFLLEMAPSPLDFIQKEIANNYLSSKAVTGQLFTVFGN